MLDVKCNGAPGWIQTNALLIRNQLLYSTKLQVQYSRGYGIRTRVSGMKVPSPRPLDEPSKLVPPAGFEPAFCPNLERLLYKSRVLTS